MKSVKITYGNLREIEKSYSEDREDTAYGYLQQLSTICNDIEAELEDDTSEAMKKAMKNLDDIRDSIRGLETSYDGISEAIRKYLRRMEGKIEANNEDSIISVTENIDGYKKRVKDCQDECKSNLRKNVGNIYTITLKDENRSLKQNANDQIDNYNDYASSTKKTVDDLFDEVVKDVKKLEDWNDADYNEAFHVTATVAKIAATAAICSTGAGAIAFGIYSAGSAVANMYNHGTSLGTSVAGGAVVGVVSFVSGKAGSAAGKKIASKFGGEGVDSLAKLCSKYADDIIPDNLRIPHLKNKFKNSYVGNFIEQNASKLNLNRFISGEGYDSLQNKIKQSLHLDKISDTKLDKLINSAKDNLNDMDIVISIKENEQVMKMFTSKGFEQSLKEQGLSILEGYAYEQLEFTDNELWNAAQGSFIDEFLGIEVPSANT